MIIRKPYAFIVKRFKLLHFIALVPVAYLIYMFFNLNQFFNKFVVNGYITNINNAADLYYSFLMVLAALVIIFFTSLIYSLFKKKKMYYFPYLLLMLFYTVVFVFCLFTKGLLTNAVEARMESSTALIVQSLTSVLFYAQIVCLPVITLLAFGFDIRTGDFLDIKDEINLDEEDSEEVEINIVKEDYKFKRWLNRYIREIKYYVIENKNVFKVLAGILGLIILFFIGNFILSLSRNVRVDQAFSHSNVSLTFNGATLSPLDYAGNYISEGKLYLAVKLSAKNITNDLAEIDTSEFCLEVNGNCIYPTLDRSGKFIDIAVPYYGEKLGIGVGHEYVLVYELDEIQAKSKYTIKILDKLKYKENEIIPQYKEIRITPNFASSIENVKTYELGDEIDFSKSNVKDTTLRVKKYSINDVYRYYYDYCYKEECTKSLNAVSFSSNNTLLVLDAEFKIDESASYFKNSKSRTAFFKDFATVKYYIDNKEHYATVIDKTPKEVSDQVVLEVSNSIKKADKMELVFTVRNKRYTLSLY